MREFQQKQIFKEKLYSKSHFEKYLPHQKPTEKSQQFEIHQEKNEMDN